MLVFNEQPRNDKPLQEKIEYTAVSPKDVYGMFIDWIKKNKGFRVHLSFSGNDNTEMDGIFNKVKIESQRIMFQNTISAYNSFYLYPKNIVNAEFAEDKETDYMSFYFVMQSKQTVHILPHN